MATAKKAKAAKPAKEEKKVGAATPEPTQEVDAAKLDAEVDSATKAPEGVPVAVEKDVTPAPLPKPKKNEDGVKAIAPTGRFVAIGNEIYNKQGVLIGVEVDEGTAARKAERFNSLHA